MFGVPVIESYGMTEACHRMATIYCPRASATRFGGPPAGPEMAVMDDDGNLLPAGETGEIVIRGANVTAGYVNNPEANAAAFTNGWFRTGDRGRTDADGYFFITGRTKEMINRGRENISPREIDESLLEHPAVGQAVAFAVPHPTLGQEVAAAGSSLHRRTVSEHELRRFVFDRLMPFKVPSRILTVPRFPKARLGNCNELDCMRSSQNALSREFVAPLSDVEQILAELWSEVPDCGTDWRPRQLLRVGGDSLSAVSFYPADQFPF